MFGKKPTTGWYSPDAGETTRLREDLVAAGVDRHTYLLSRLDRALAGGVEDGSLYAWREEGGPPAGCLYVGEDLNLAVSDLGPAARTALAAQVERYHRGVSIAVSPAAELEALVAGLAGRTSPLLQRRQSLYAVERDLFRDPGRPELEPAAPADVPRLVEASIGLAVEDLAIARWRMSRLRVERTVRRRLDQGRTWVVRRGRRVVFKLDVAVRTREAVLIEGIYTFPEHRGQGYATRGVAAFLALALADHPRVNLHVGRDNRVARRTYERAGMVEVGELGLVLFRPWR